MNTQINDPLSGQWDLIMTLIITEHQYHDLAHIIRDKDLCGGIIVKGEGTVSSATLNLLGIKGQKRILVNIPHKKEMASEILDILTRELKLDKPGHGIVYTNEVMTGDQIIGKKHNDWDTAQKMEGESMLNKLTVVVNRGMAEDVIDITRKAGVKGGTILHGRGVGADCDVRLFGIEIEPERELVVVILPSNLTEKVVNELYSELKLDIPGNGILYVEPVLDVRGIMD
ncbi:MAG: P-II family nitrogen regulator [Lentihominibacter sp.]|jgi:nitrogen regulatory protein PII